MQFVYPLLDRSRPSGQGDPDKAHVASGEAVSFQQLWYQAICIKVKAFEV